MESLSETTWDVLISGTGLQQSLLALALSRSNKKVLHVDKNVYYGGDEAALSLQETEVWVKEINQDAHTGNIRDASLSLKTGNGSSTGDEEPKLAFSRAYSLSLSPQIIYARSSLLKILISSKIYHQLEFLSVGSWWVYEAGNETTPGTSGQIRGSLKKVPNGREDVFSDKSIDLKSKRVLMNFLRFVADYENQPEKWDSWATKPLSDFLFSEFSITPNLQSPLLVISMTPDTPEKTAVASALPNIARHLRSIGLFGPGFGAITPRWGGSGEICQVACRAGAVGGGVYVLGRGVEAIAPTPSDDDGTTTVELEGGEKVKARRVVGSRSDIPSSSDPLSPAEQRTTYNSISIVSSSLSSLLPITAEGAPPPAGAVVVFPTGSFHSEGLTPSDTPPIYVVLHSSDTGECPQGQSVLYASVSSTSTTADSQVYRALLDQATTRLLSSVPDESSPPQILYTLHYTRSSPPSPPASASEKELKNEKILLFPPPSTDSPVFDDGVIDRVTSVWEQITRTDGAADDAEAEAEAEDRNEAFMQFEEREGVGLDDDEENM